MLRKISHLLDVNTFYSFDTISWPESAVLCGSTWGSEKMQMRLTLWLKRFQPVNSETTGTMISGKKIFLGEAKMAELKAVL